MENVWTRPVSVPPRGSALHLGVIVSRVSREEEPLGLFVSTLDMLPWVAETLPQTLPTRRQHIQGFACNGGGKEAAASDSRQDGSLSHVLPKRAR